MTNIKRMLLAASNAGAFACKAVTFDGTNDYMSRADFIGNVDGKSGIFSCWVNFQGGDGTLQGIFNGTGNVANAGDFCVQKDTGNQFGVHGNPFTRLTVQSNSNYVASSGWVHLLVSWDLANTRGWLYIDDADDIKANPTYNDGNIDYTEANQLIGNVATYKLNSYISEVYFNNAEYLDLSVEANRRKFINADGKPVDLGSNGSTPTGTSPICYQSVRDGEAATVFGTNKGTGGNFSITGALAISPSSPSD